MNETIALIKRRRSIRHYKQEQILGENLHAILESALSAPSAMNQQRWYFVVIQNKSLIQKIKGIARENILFSSITPLVERAKNPDFNPFHDAPTIVFVFADQNAKFSLIDASLAAQNMLIAAESLNLGSCIIALSEFAFMLEKGEQLKKELGVPEKYVHVCGITLGYKADDNPPAPPRNKEVVIYFR